MLEALRRHFPPENPEEAGPACRSRLFERFADLLPVVSYSVMLWCAVVFYLLKRSAAGDGSVNELAHILGLTTRSDLAEGRLWGLIASTCIHFDLLHFAFNMIWLAKLGPLMERGLGSMKTLAFFISAGFVSSILQLFIGGTGIGFSGIIYAMGGFIWGAWPRYTGFLESFRASSLRWLLVWQVLCFLLSWGNIIPIANTAHVAGLTFGLLVGLWACRGNQRGWHWLVASLMLVIGSLALALSAMNAG